MNDTRPSSSRRMLDNSGESGPPCGRTLHPWRCHSSFEYPSLEVTVYERQHLSVSDLAFHQRHKGVVVDSVKDMCLLARM